MVMLRHSVFAVLIGISAFGMIPTAARSASHLEARTSDAGGVRVVVKPKSVVAAMPWEFEVTMDTHSKPLEADLTKSAVLIDDREQRYPPVAWQGDKPGGHHRKGLLRFAAPAAPTKSFEVRIEGLGGVATRTFRWKTD